MVGLEYILLHVHEPILYVIRKQHRHNPQEATPIADYYIIGGTIYKAPDLGNVISSRIVSYILCLLQENYENIVLIFKTAFNSNEFTIRF